ncbi:MAG: DNRLRE domain-containing protein [Anaerolineae bacterium]|nr:DNRLRE domain-containing protein [Anaerolineae bacterium]
MKKWAFILALFISMGSGVLTWAQGSPTPPIQYPDLSVGVLSEDPGYGERWSTEIFPFGNYVGPTTGRDVFCRTYLRFSIPSSSASIVRAVLNVYVDDYWPGPGAAPMSVYPVAEDWPAGVDWYDMTTWPELGSAVATITVTSDGGWFSWDVTGLVREWASGARPNYGLALAAADLNSTAANWAAARRLSAGDPATRPYLALEWATPTPTPVPTATLAPPAAPPPPAPSLTPTPVLVLLPETGGRAWAAGWLLGGVGLALLLLAGVLRSRGRSL